MLTCKSEYVFDAPYVSILYLEQERERFGPQSVFAVVGVSVALRSFCAGQRGQRPW